MDKVDDMKTAGTTVYNADRIVCLKNKPFSKK